MRLMLHFCTTLGPRVVIAEVSDAATANAIAAAHAANGGISSLLEEMPRLSLKSHMAKQKRAAAKVKPKLEVITAPANVTPIRKGKQHV